MSTLRFPIVVDDEWISETLVGADRSLETLREEPYYHSVRNTLFAYVHLDDLAVLFRRCVEAGFEGHETFWAAAPDTTVDLPSADLVAEEYPDAAVPVELEGYESLVDTTKAEDLLGWSAEKRWRQLG